MWIFITLVSFGLAFMLYALVQFCRESNRTKETPRRDSSPEIVEAQPGRLVKMVSKRISARRSSHNPKLRKALS